MAISLSPPSPAPTNRLRFRRLVALLAIALPAGVAAREDPPAAPRSAPPSALAAPVAGIGVVALLAAADDITRQVAALRGLEPRKPVAKGVLTRDEIGVKLKERIAKEYTADEIRIESRILKRLGLLPEDVAYEKLLLDLLMDQVAGFYDPFSRQLYIADWLGVELQRPALAHEIEHVLQDQHFDLKGFATPLKEEGDRQLARLALVEGDGTAVMLEFVAQQLGVELARAPQMMESLGRQLADGAMKQSPEFARAPRILRETLLFPYYSGMKFVFALQREARSGVGPSWKRVDEAFRNPPESTEQVLHPEKYLAHEHPIPVTAAPVTALAPARELRRDVLGELEWRVLLESRLPDGEAQRAAAGWGGDRVVAYGDPEPAAGAKPATGAAATAGEGKPVVLIDLSTWDSERDAVEAEVALRKLFARQMDKPGAEANAGAGAHHPAAVEGAVFDRDGEAWSAERRGRNLLALFGVPSGKRAAVSDEVWRTWRVGKAH